MPCINVRDGDGVINIYALDGCGNPIAGPRNKLVIDTVPEAGWEDTVEEGDEVTERNFVNRKFYSDVGADEISNIAVNLTGGGVNPALDAILMNARVKLRNDIVVGYGRLDLSSAQAVAVEVLVQLDADACAEGASAAPIAGWLFPFVKNWRPNGGTTLNGTDLVKPAFTGKGFKNPRLRTGIGGGGITDVDLMKWDDDEVYQADEWYTFYVFDGDTYALPTPDCEPVALA